MNIYKIFINYRLVIKIRVVVIFSLALYGLFSITKSAYYSIKVNSDDYKVETININEIENQIVFTGIARDTATGSIVEFNYASPDIVKADPQLLKAILDKLAATIVKKSE